MPFLRWPGAKRWLVERLVPEIVSAKPTRYVEPFLGGGAIALGVGSRNPTLPMTLGDKNEALVNVWRMVAQFPDAVALETAKCLSLYGNRKDGYERAREAFNRQRPMGIIAAGLMIYLNKVNYNGLWRENSRGQMNVPFGDVKNPVAPTADELGAIAAILRPRTKLVCGDGGALVDTLRSGEAVYADPPYDSGFTAYTADGFSDDAQRSLAEKLRTAAERGARVWATNANTERVRSLYGWAEIEEISEPRRIAPKGDRAAACVLIRG